ncbi:hypothetical protein ACJMK2_017176 [Sinanodonta woodiana]|uniref:BTB domain-containing protein n=1 Tax=Sinanodonta woodiana TaxID=1069815 RepID=A0ABD3UXD6_SINWO
MDVLKQDGDREFRHRLDDMRENGILCDAFICIPGEKRTFPVHRAVMASCSHYFKSLFTSELHETSQTDIKINGVSAETMELLIQYAYLKELQLTPENIEDIFAASDRFNILGLLNDCVAFISLNLTAENCIGVLRFSQVYNCLVLIRKCWDFIMKHFLEIAEISKEFVQLEPKELLDFLSDDTLCAKEEKDVLHAVINWFNFSPEERERHLPDLISTVRMAFVDQEVFREILINRKEFKKKRKIWKRIQRAQNLIRIMKKSKIIPIEFSKNDLMAVPRIPYEIIFTIGGWAARGVTNSVETFDRNTNQWFEVPDCELPTPRAYHGSVSMDECIYVIGGFDGGRYLNSMYCFDLEKIYWEERAPMYMSRCYVCAGQIDGVVYACGGFDGRQRHMSAEKYDKARNQWSLIQPMIHHRSDSGTATLNGKLFVVGGSDGHTYLNSAEVYDPQSGQWTLLKPMSIRRCGVSLVCFQDLIYAVGGYDGTNRLKTVEMYDPLKEAWYSAPSMNVGRSNFAAVAMDDGVYAIGGYDGDKTSNVVECYNPKRKTWIYKTNLHMGRSAVSACSVKHIPNARHFSFHDNCKSRSFVTHQMIKGSQHQQHVTTID